MTDSGSEPGRSFCLAINLIAEHTDNVQGGLGMKLWLGEKSAARGLLDLKHTNVPGTTDTLIGALLGAEFELVENMNLFGEYNLLVEINEPDFTVDLGLGNNAQIGIIVKVLPPTLQKH